jgi:hypothetical protein
MSGTIDYGTGDCDNKGTYTQNGIVISNHNVIPFVFQNI